MQTPAPAAATLPAYLTQLTEKNLIVLDVRQDIATSNDPFKKIMDAVAAVGAGHALLIINTFEPTPLIAILGKKGYTSFTDTRSADLVYTYFWQEKAAAKATGGSITPPESDFDAALARFGGKVKRIDVRMLEMPQPMVTILGELELLPADAALYVVHKRVPRFLLPQLEERGFQVVLNEVGPNEVYLLIFK